MLKATRPTDSFVAETPTLNPNRAEPVYWRLKALLDLAISLVALLVLAIPMGLIALLIKLTSPGPIFFRQTRLGKNCRPFTIYKFRTMYHNTSTELHRAYIHQLIRAERGAEPKGPTWLPPAADNRVTPLGRWLRRTGLDELPQLFNVLRGEMSLVGPRPPLEYEVELYESWQLERMAVAPGITGLWQVSARGKCSFEEMVRLDIEYIERCSWQLDLWLLLITVPSRLTNSVRYRR